MPERDGIDFLAEVKQNWPWIDRILLTGRPQLQPVFEALEGGVISRFVTKPWSVQRMAQEVDGILKRSTRTMARTAPRS